MGRGRKATPYTICGQTHTIAEWANIVGLPTDTVRARMYKGWPIEKAIAIQPDTDYAEKRALAGPRGPSKKHANATEVIESDSNEAPITDPIEHVIVVPTEDDSDETCDVSDDDENDENDNDSVEIA